MKNFFVLLLLFISINSYSQWVQTGSGITGDAIIGSLTLDNNILYACSYNINLTGGIFKSTNNGLNWTQIPFNNHSVPAFLVKNGYYIAAVGEVANSGVYVSSNGGNNWIQGSLRKDVKCLAAFGNIIFAGTQSGIYTSTDNGYNWSQSFISDNTIKCLAGDSTIIYAGTGGVVQVYYSTDCGVSWNPTTFGISIYSLAYSGSKVYAGTFQHGAFVSTNRGTNWTRIYPDYNSIASIIADNNKIYLGLNYNGTGGFAVSTDYGSTWTNKIEGFVPSTLGVVSLLSYNNYIFAGTTYSVWRRPVSNIISVSNLNTEIPSGYSLYQNYPNPFNPSTTIKFDIPKSSNVRLIVYDITGKEVETLVNEKLAAGTYETKWDGGNLTSGIYFCALISGDRLVKSVKMILSK